MEIKDLRTFLEDYRAKYEEDFIEIDEPLNYKFESQAIVDHFQRQDKFPIVLYHKIKTIDGNISPHPVVMNLEERNKLAFAINSSFHNLANDWVTRGNNKIPPVTVEKKEAPCKENVLLGEEINLFNLPIGHRHDMDGGRYITAGVFTCYDPETWTDNGARHRGFIAGPREIRCLLAPGSHAHMNLQAHENRNEPMKVAYWIGHHPAVWMGTQLRIPYRESHYSAAGGVLGEPLRVVPSETLGNDFLVPADAEFVIEGLMHPGKRDLEGPFGEYTGYYGPQRMSPCFEVTAVTFRNGAIWHSHGNAWLGTAMNEASLFEVVKRAIPETIQVRMPRSGTGYHHVYVQLKKTHDGQPKQAIMAALGAYFYVKCVIVVDEDVNIWDESDVLWAIATRVHWDEDLVMVKDAMGSILDPASNEGELVTKVGIDATKPAYPGRYPVRFEVPKEVMQTITLEKYITPEKLAKVPQSRAKEEW